MVKDCGMGVRVIHNVRPGVVNLTRSERFERKAKSLARITIYSAAEIFGVLGQLGRLFPECSDDAIEAGVEGVIRTMAANLSIDVHQASRSMRTFIACATAGEVGPKERPCA